MCIRDRNSISFLNPRKIGYKVVSYIGVFLDQPSHYPDVIKALKNVNEVVEAHYTTGTVSYTHLDVYKRQILKRAMDKGLAEIYFHQLRNFGLGKYRQIDDEPYGGGAGMVMMIEPLDKCISELKSQRDYDEVIYLTPDGETLNQKIANTLSIKNNLIFLCGHYKGIDQRVRQLHITKEISIGDYVLTGGELAACVLADSVIRLLPGVLNDEQSALTDSFQDDLLCLLYTSRCV